MPVPAKRRSSSSGKRRRSQDSMKKEQLSVCPKCGQAKQPHKACLFCGEYNGRAAVEVKVKKETK